jgi:hypothetical protein
MMNARKEEGEEIKVRHDERKKIFFANHKL